MLLRPELCLGEAGIPKGYPLPERDPYGEPSEAGR